MSSVSLAKTELLTNGYIKHIEKHLESKNIATDIINLILSYIENCYRNSGEYTWKINNLHKLQEIIHNPPCISLHKHNPNPLSFQSDLSNE